MPGRPVTWSACVCEMKIAEIFFQRRLSRRSADLRALPAVEEEQLPFAAQQHRRQAPARQGHHAAL